MHAWITTRPVDTNQLERATFILETLNSESSQPILHALKEHHNVTVFELTMYTGLNNQEVEQQLEKLCETGTVTADDENWQVRFSLNEKRLSKIAACARALAAGFQEQ
ncbi:MAG: hypothetical protein J5I98_17315 [Phaeodactylibacter sp.]|nr:hypothetical protein [Phaeodactylibacter sp.]